MITIIPPKEFKTVPWKNGLGETIELAINDGGTLSDFDWRLSIATVANDGPFSNFAGLTRNLVLIEGNGISLEHSAGYRTAKGHMNTDTLTSLLEVANFYGGLLTVGKLLDGPIKDFNVMVKTGRYRVSTDTYTGTGTDTGTDTDTAPIPAPIPTTDLCFVYGLNGDIVLTDADGEVLATLPQGHLLRLNNPKAGMIVTGQMMIVVGIG